MPTLEYYRAAPKPVALVLLDWVEDGRIVGTELAHRDESGVLYGVRTITQTSTTYHDDVLDAFIRSDVADKGMVLDDKRTKAPAPGTRQEIATEALRAIKADALAQASCQSPALMRARLNAIADKATAALRAIS